MAMLPLSRCHACSLTSQLELLALGGPRTAAVKQQRRASSASTSRSDRPRPAARVQPQASTSTTRSQSSLVSDLAGSSSTTGRSRRSPAANVRAPLGRLYMPSTQEVVDGLAHACLPLRLVPQSIGTADRVELLMLRIVTHKSAAGSTGNHNGRLAFLGRRLLRGYTSIFLHQHATLLPAQLNGDHLDKLLNQYALGNTDGPAKRLSLEKIMRWRSVVDPQGLETGLFKCRGMALEALLGAIFLQLGAFESLRFYSLKILPFLALPPQLRAASSSASQDLSLFVSPRPMPSMSSPADLTGPVTSGSATTSAQID
ncbi:uncharacterized protein L969DRAFT_91649 [Mixia osmundae IAM 14324]|uniref:RNase III domain-containing protein n=1 Tax=Mixia osmundae (strain CBS 9802 / IAM 14324 / JCM 22182 / KY 12970) TaxID=764103 RepID=G7E034_MIXOS|nr:uncharacterized protein L969DRAFT_91649 [Mixia osmundae IAM 14324]KEI42186.1 hypothetical protein L969DRAFT_91649 [Mixia osmundae IAM 14324]GAA96194.1 hypothetical protein E5Q_02858 [Mixia osmundae IAM 14324]